MSKELVKKYDNHPVLAGDYQEIVKENLGDEGLKVSDLPRIKMPSGGTTAWEVPALGEPEMKKKIKGVIIHRVTSRAFWSKGIGEAEDNLPDCMSPDGKDGAVLNEDEFDNLGGDCSTCPMNQWGSGDDGKGKACTERLNLYIVKDGFILPNIISLSPTSIKPARKYLVELVGYSRPYHTVVTEFELEKAKNDSGIEYAVAKLSYGGDLPKDTIKEIAGFRENFIKSLEEPTAEDMPADAKTR
ncbi:hypothetical protein AKJ51_04620 [candidate division MSBL1 archaeon SCGC-AAA382A20]|uniref:Uncharacterized protein n=1 Tax=candidate division MSBL1 archaeon SCGC-AAA382A20 TaxID=1698280 RepID=A0A133VHF1_9EURY|nr:hypothetical protein AKJ51_04620 [candidate division MSBL1 archaeon SCGC-AAA382A20]